MSDPYVRTVGELDDYDGIRVIVGVNYDTVSIRIGGRDGDVILLDAAGAEDFERLFVSAVWQAGQQKARLDAEDDG